MFNVKYALPYSDVDSLTAEQRKQRFDPRDPIEFGHTLEQLLGGLTKAGFAIDAFMEDHAQDDPLSRYLATYYMFSSRKS